MSEKEEPRQKTEEMVLHDELVRAINRTALESDISTHQILGVMEALKFDLISNSIMEVD